MISTTLLQTEVTSSIDLFSHPILKDPYYMALLSVIAVLFICMFILANTFKTVFKTLYPDAIKEKDTPKEKSVIEVLTNYVPIEEEHTILMDHEYDGIRELDNNLPPWWVYMFYICIVFAVVYMAYYHMLGGPTSKQEYDTQVTEYKAKKEAEKKSSTVASVDENTVTLLIDAGSIASGKSLFEASCQACHGPAGKGLNGPNLTDDSWLYGGSIKDIFATVKYGKIEKGMPGWNVLGGNKIQAIASYIKQLKYIAPPEGKAPQGNKYVEESLPADSIK